MEHNHDSYQTLSSRYVEFAQLKDSMLYALTAGEMVTEPVCGINALRQSLVPLKSVAGEAISLKRQVRMPWCRS